METGKVVKYIRLSKKIKSGNVYTGILSRPAISRFEKGLSDTTTEKLFKIISNLNVSLDEFYYIYNKYNRDNDYDFYNEYSQAFYSNDLDFFSEELILTLYKRTKRKLEDFTQLRKYNNEVFSLLTNILVVFITKNDIEKSVYFYNELKNSISETNNKMYEKVMLNFFKELVNLIDTKQINNQNIEKIIMLFDYLDMPMKKNQCIYLYENVVNNNKIIVS